MADGPDEDFALTLVGDGISIEKKVNRQIAIAVFKAVFGGGAAETPVERVEADDQLRIALSPREFLTESEASNNAEKITALGHYMRVHEAKENFSKEDLKEGFRRAHEVIPKNLSRDVGIAIKAGWIHAAPGKAGRYYMTHTGMKLVESKFRRPK